MSEFNQDPSMLYDEEFMKKRQEMFGDASFQADISSGREKDEPEKEATEKERRGLFSALKRKKKNEDDDEDIFDEFEVDFAPQTQDEAPQVQDSLKIDDINALLESVGITPVREESAQENIAQEEIAQAENAETQKGEEGTAEEENAEAQKGDGEALREEEDEKETQAADEKGFTKAVPLSESEPKQPEDGKTKHYGKADGAQAQRREKSEKESDISGQMILDGYKDEDAPEKVSEAEVEEKLKSTRKNLIDNFRVLAKDTDDRTLLEREGDAAVSASVTDEVKVSKGEDIFAAVEKAGKKTGAALKRVGERTSVKALQKKAKKEKRRQQSVSAGALCKQLKSERKTLSVKLKALVVLTAVLLILSFLVSGYTQGGALEFLFGGGARIYTAVNLVLYAVSVGLCFGKFKNAAEDILSRKANGQSVLLVVNLFVLMHTVLSLITGLDTQTGILLYTPFASFAMLASLYGDYVKKTSLLKSASMLKGKELLGVQSIVNKADAAALGHGLSTSGEPVIYYGAQTQFPENITQSADENTAEEKYYAVTGIAVLALAVLFGAVFAVVLKSGYVFGAGLAGLICLCMPLLRETVLALLFAKTNAAVLPGGAAVLSFDEANALGKADAAIFDSKDVFEASVSRFRVVPGSKMAQSDAVVYTASTLKKTNSLLANCFDDFIEECGITLPEAEDLTYEDGLGYGSWVAGRRVLVGNLEMLQAHSIECPTKEEEQAYAKGKSVMYLAVEGVIAATFTVNFKLLPQTKKNMQYFYATGLVFMLSCADPWLNEDNASAKLGTDKATIKLVGTKGAQIIESYKSNKLLGEKSSLVCTKKQNSVLSVINAADGLYCAQKLSRLIYTVGIVLSFVLLTLFAALGISTAFSNMAVIVLQLIWSAVSYSIGAARLLR